MTSRKRGADQPVWLGQEPAHFEAFGGGELWIGEHTTDRDILVLDPAATDATAGVLSLYSLTQHRLRRFPRSLVQQMIRPLDDEPARARAREEYAGRASLREAHQDALSTARAEHMDGVREQMIGAHQRFVEKLGLEYQGVNPTAGTKVRRAVKCHACGLGLDDFVGVACARCAGVLCSCGACACGKSARGRSARALEPEPEAGH